MITGECTHYSATQHCTCSHRHKPASDSDQTWVWDTPRPAQEQDISDFLICTWCTWKILTKGQSSAKELHACVAGALPVCALAGMVTPPTSDALVSGAWPLVLPSVALDPPTLIFKGDITVDWTAKLTNSVDKCTAFALIAGRVASVRVATYSVRSLPFRSFWSFWSQNHKFHIMWWFICSYQWIHNTHLSGHELLSQWECSVMSRDESAVFC